MEEEFGQKSGLGGEGTPTWEYVPQHMEDKDVEVAIHNALLLDPELEVDHFIFRSDAGVVTLQGRVTSDEQHRRAVNLVLGLPGVRRVVDLIEGDVPQGPEEPPLD